MSRPPRRSSAPASPRSAHREGLQAPDVTDWEPTLVGTAGSRLADRRRQRHLGNCQPVNLLQDPVRGRSAACRRRRRGRVGVTADVPSRSTTLHRWPRRWRGRVSRVGARRRRPTYALRTPSGGDTLVAKVTVPLAVRVMREPSAARRRPPSPAARVRLTEPPCQNCSAPALGAREVAQEFLRSDNACGRRTTASLEKVAVKGGQSNRLTPAAGSLSA